MEKDCPVNEVCSRATEGLRRYQIYDAATPQFPRSCETMREWLEQIAPELPTSRLLGAIWYHRLRSYKLSLCGAPHSHPQYGSGAIFLETSCTSEQASKQTNRKHNFAAKEGNIYMPFIEIISRNNEINSNACFSTQPLSWSYHHGTLSKTLNCVEFKVRIEMVQRTQAVIHLCII